MKRRAIITVIAAVSAVAIISAMAIYFFIIVNPITVKPEVRVSDNEYYENTTGETFWEPPIWERFENEYAGRFSVRLQQECVSSMKDQAKDLGQDPTVLERCIDACGEFDEPEYHVSLPCLAERARFNGTEVWIIVYIWGMDTNDLGHIRYFVVDIETREILQFETCG
jgi:hypothetical protein